MCVCVFVFAEVCVKEMAACAADETCKGLHTKVQMLMKKDSGYGKDGEGKEGGYGGKGGDTGGDKKEEYGGKKEGGYGDKDTKDGPPPKSTGRRLEHHGEKKAMPKKPVQGGGDKAPSAELKAAMEACKKNELCRALMECKMKHKESGGKGLRLEHQQIPN